MTDEKKIAASREEKTVLLSKLPGSMRRLLEGTPSREWYKIRAVSARYEESVELTKLVPVLDHILEVAPGRCVTRMRQAAITPQALDDGFRRIRDAINGLKDACRHVAALGEMEIRAWKDSGSGALPAVPLIPRKEAS